MNPLFKYQINEIRYLWKISGYELTREINKISPIFSQISEHYTNLPQSRKFATMTILISKKKTKRFPSYLLKET